MRVRAITVCILSAGLFLIFGCDKLDLFKNKKAAPQKAQPAAVVKGTAIAKVNNMPITLEDLNEEIEAYNAMVPADKPELKVTTREQKLDYLKNRMIRQMLLYQEAVDRGMERNEAVQKELEKTKVSLLVVALVNEEAKKVDVSSKEVEDYYNAYKEQFKDQEERQVREISVPTEQEAKDILVLLLQGADFATLARERSKSGSAANGGDLGFIGRGKRSPQFDAVAFTKDVGKSDYFKDGDGYCIVKVEAVRGGKQKTLSEMWDDIKRLLTFLKQQQRIDDLIGKLSRESKAIEVYEGSVK